MSDLVSGDGTLSRDEAGALLREIWLAASRLSESGHRDLVHRAAEVKAMTHFMLYDFDGGVEADR
ncbi:hypothetical protein QRB36_05240 [Mycobacterium marseillense]|jgi:hypothetical protein|uniref:Uncharacterized protein n=1 Tax=Mycobacterium [tuberculosis] TKK-01-0051 TaxID=1324261 RepID=A0A051TVK4_9MYCO|nr:MULTISPECIES: hypothetical protein [Mycobacterium avium complex (MAC)]KBZ60992.1 hypothetical protein K875_03943 [Mycobacterium [tuberculosis] TKK-01-0051]MDM3973569.1 hypothetical protein [Mycobacterium marseillense]